MNYQQQAQSDFYPAFNGGGPMSHSPNSTRPGYATSVGVPSALGAGGGGARRNQQGQLGDGMSPSASASLYGDDRFASFDPSQRFDRVSATAASAAATQSNLQNAFAPFGGGGSSQPSWSYSPGSAATLSGNVNDGGRVRSAARRTALHSEWVTPSEPSLGAPQGGAGSHGGLPFYPPQQHLVNPSMHPSASSPDPFSVPSPGVNTSTFLPPPEIRTFSDPKKDMGDLIPTAIVIKNIPFNVRKEFLTSVMVEMHLPQPYAFNYHFDQGVFRGLAFANFQNAQDTALVIERMNGLDIQGRKLRVEYKKMLPEHERERIEREKREKRGQLEEQHRGPAHQISISSITTSASAPRQPINDRLTGRVDLNDPHTLQYYLEIYMFQNDDNREVHIFPADTSPEDRRLIHILAHNMGLEHTSIGEGENRQIHISKSKFATGARQHAAQQPGVTLDGHPRGLSRAATYDFNDRQHPSAHSIGRGPTLAIPNSPENHQHGMNGLRGVKSFADLRSFSPSPSPSLVSGAGLPPAPSNGHKPGGGVPFLTHYTGESPFGATLTTPTTPGSIMHPPNSAAAAAGAAGGPADSTNLGSLTLGSSTFDASSTGLAGGRPRETPGAIGSQRPGVNGSGSRANPERQPRGPATGSDWENSVGFSRGRTNGHMQRGSDSSDNTGRAASGQGPQPPLF